MTNLDTPSKCEMRVGYFLCIAIFVIPLAIPIVTLGDNPNSTTMLLSMKALGILFWACWFYTAVRTDLKLARDAKLASKLVAAFADAGVALAGALTTYLIAMLCDVTLVAGLSRWDFWQFNRSVLWGTIALAIVSASIAFLNLQKRSGATSQNTLLLATGVCLPLLYLTIYCTTAESIPNFIPQPIIRVLAYAAQSIGCFLALKSLGAKPRVIGKPMPPGSVEAH